MQKPISTKVHGVLDYVTAAFLHTLPRAMGWSRQVTAVLDGAGAAATAYSLVTKYELSAAKVLPMPAHLTMDAISGAGLIGAALLLDDEDPEVRATLAGIGAFEIAVAMLTHPVPQRVYARKAKPAGVGSVESGAWSQPSMPSAPTPATASA
ncbi:MAG TPA: hypothetical protein VFB66_01205 [Tepidisphaeraceae bacterium]|nr:hypothetical protein [Tepidisphaeraceae bacterium]